MLNSLLGFINYEVILIWPRLSWKGSPSENLRLRHMDPTHRSQSRSHSSAESSEQNTRQPPAAGVTRVTGYLGFRNTQGSREKRIIALARVEMKT